MGIGAGWKEDEYDAYGFPYPDAKTRVEQLEDTLHIMKDMWSNEGPVTHQGKHYSVEDAYCEPRPDPVPPIMVGGAGRMTTLVAARHADWWNIPDSNFPYYRERMTILKEHCANIGRDPDSIRLTWWGRLVVGKTQSDAEALGAGKWTRDNAIVGTPRQAVEQMEQFVEIGVDYFMFEVLGLPNPDVIGMVLNEVLSQWQN
jgi:alkanesulfonate monooxygenase SsuD/methylene tetrahydromethanopterin reductase-like flavin-dependent oxidoreductase (luciferase family)